MGMLGGMSENMRAESPVNEKISFKETYGILGISQRVLWQWLALGVFEQVVKEATPGSRPHEKLWFDRGEVERVRDYRARITRARMILRRRAFGEIVLEDDDLLTTGEAGLLLGHTNVTVASMIREGWLEAASRTSGGHYRIRYGEVRALLKSRGQL